MTHPYASLAYAKAFGPTYEPIYLPGMDLHVLKRPIEDTPYFDAMGPYPLAPISSLARIREDFECLAKQSIVSLVLVSDPSCIHSEDEMAAAFDGSSHYKDHFIREPKLGQPYSRHHRAEVRRAFRRCETKITPLAEHLDDWCDLYSTLVDRHQITGVQAFDRRYFEALVELEPIMVSAFCEGRFASAHIWLLQGNHAYSHLAASSAEGYRQSAAYAVYDHSFRYFEERGIESINLGGGAGVNSASSGLSFLKQGFSTKTVVSHLCTKIIDPVVYADLSAGLTTTFFPAYRSAIIR